MLKTSFYMWMWTWYVPDFYLSRYFTAFLREDEPLKMFQQRKDIIFSHKSLSFWININASCSKCCALFTIYICLTFKTRVYFRLIGKCMAKTNWWKCRIRRKESGVNPSVPCLHVWISNQSEWIFKLLIPKQLCAIWCWAERMGQNQLHITTALHQRTGLVPGARWSWLKVASVPTSLVSSCCWCSGFDMRHLCCRGAGNQNQEDDKSSAKMLLGKSQGEEILMHVFMYICIYKIYNVI